MIGRLRRHLARRRLERRARLVLRAMFSDPTRLAGTSLRPAHVGRVDIVECDGDEEGNPTRIEFTILRHPRPYPFSSQHHLVAELWRVECPDGPPERLRGLNLSRLEGEDGRPAGGP